MAEQDQIDFRNGGRKNKSKSQLKNNGNNKEAFKSTQRFNGLWARGQILPPSSISVHNGSSSNFGSPISPDFPISPVEGYASGSGSGVGVGIYGSGSGSASGSGSGLNSSSVSIYSGKSGNNQNLNGNQNPGASTSSKSINETVSASYRPRKSSTLSNGSNAENPSRPQPQPQQQQQSQLQSHEQDSHQSNPTSVTPSISPVINRRRTQSSASMTNSNRRFALAENQPLPNSPVRTGFFPSSIGMKSKNQDSAEGGGEELEFLGEESKTFVGKNRNRTNSDGLGRTSRLTSNLNPQEISSNNLFPPKSLRMDSFHSASSSTNQSNSSNEVTESNNEKGINSSSSSRSHFSHSQSSSPHLSPREIPRTTFEETDEEIEDGNQKEMLGLGQVGNYGSSSSRNQISNQKRRSRSNSRNENTLSKPSSNSSLRSDGFNSYHQGQFIGSQSNSNHSTTLSAAEQAQEIFKKTHELVNSRNQKSQSHEPHLNPNDSKSSNDGSGITELLAAFGETLALERNKNRSRQGSRSGISASSISGSNINPSSFNDSDSKSLNPNQHSNHSTAPGSGFKSKSSSFNGNLSPRMNGNRGIEVEDLDEAGDRERIGLGGFDRRKSSSGSKSGKQPPSPLLKELFLDANATSSHSIPQTHPSEIIRSSSVTGIYNQPISPSSKATNLNPNYPPPASPASARSADITRSSANGILPPPNYRSNTLPVLNDRNSEDLLRVGRYAYRENPVTPIMNQSPSFGIKNGLLTPGDKFMNSKNQNPISSSSSSSTSSPSRNSSHRHSPSMPTELPSSINSFRNQTLSPNSFQKSSSPQPQTHVMGNPRQLDFGNSLGGIDLNPEINRNTFNPNYLNISYSNSIEKNNPSTDSKNSSSSLNLGLVGLGFKGNHGNESNLSLNPPNTGFSSSNFSNSSDSKEINNKPSFDKEKISFDLGSKDQNVKTRRNLVKNFWSGIKGGGGNDSK